MTEASEATGRDSLGGGLSPMLGPIRLGIGLLQGLGLFWLHSSADNDLRTWPATEPLLFGPLLLIVAFLPMVLLAGVGRLRPLTLAIWTVVASVALALLGLHDIARQSADTLRHSPFLSAPVFLFSAVALFISHHLVAPADLERRRIASFPAYFDTTWKAGVQLVMSAAFTGAFWILLFLGAALFRVIGLTFLEDLIRQDWFWIPVTLVVFSISVHLTDVRDGLIRGVRTVALMLLSWLLLVLTVLVAGFLAALPFTGLEGLWQTGSATALVLSAAAALIILINTAYQDGRPDNLPPLVLRLAVRVAALLILPLIVIAVWGLSLRIGQYGLTPDRIIAAACALVGAAYAAGYGWAALRPTWVKGAPWMQPLEPTNIATAVLEIAVILALFSPIADPARLSVADQVARLERGAVKADQFDYRFLRFQGGKAGEAALDRLSQSSDPVVARSARNMLAIDRRRDGSGASLPDDLAVYEVVPAGARLPESFATPLPAADPRREVCRTGGDCVARTADMDGDGVAEVLVANSSVVQLWAIDAEGGWRIRGSWSAPPCVIGADGVDPREALRSGEVGPVEPRWPDLAFGDRRSSFIRHPGCEAPEPPG